MRALLALALCLVVAFASQTEAVARSEMAGASDQVLCGGQGAVRVTLDTQGHAVNRHPCTHCLAAVTLAILHGPALLPLAPIPKATRLRQAMAAPDATRPAPVPSARAPPVLRL